MIETKPVPEHQLETWYETPVYYEDTDFSGFVYHANYLKFFERAREHLLGIDAMREMFKQGVHFVVYDVQAKFLSPARHGDHIAVHTLCRFNQSPRLRFEQIAYNDRNLTNARKLVDARITVVMIDKDGRPLRISPEIEQALLAKAMTSHP